jgi:hypothetical protein
MTSASYSTVQQTRSLCLAFETRDADGIGCEGLRQHFDRDGTTHSRVSRPVYLAHAADPERRIDLVPAQHLPVREPHGRYSTDR